MPLITSSRPFNRFKRSPNSTPLRQYLGNSKMSLAGLTWLLMSFTSSTSHLSSLYFVFSSTGYTSTSFFSIFKVYICCIIWSMSSTWFVLILVDFVFSWRLWGLCMRGGLLSSPESPLWRKGNCLAISCSNSIYLSSSLRSSLATSRRSLLRLKFVPLWDGSETCWVSTCLLAESRS